MNFDGKMYETAKELILLTTNEAAVKKKIEHTRHKNMDIANEMMFTHRKGRYQEIRRNSESLTNQRIYSWEPGNNTYR